MQNYFYELADYVTTLLKADEVYLASCSGEDSDFIRFNHGLSRQAGSVCQRELSLDLIRGQRHVKSSIGLSGQVDVDRPRTAALVDELRSRLDLVPEDPYLLYSTEVRNSEQKADNKLPPRDKVLDEIVRAGAGRDMVGIYAGGGIYSGFANSLGQRNWFQTYSFHLDWCFYHAADKAVKTNYAGFAWDDAEFTRKVDDAADQLKMLQAPARTIKPGAYRVYLAPGALDEFVGMLSWGGFSCKAHRTKTTPLLKMVEQGATMSPTVTLRENTAEGIAPNFQSAGYIKPAAVTLIGGGKYAECLTSPRSAKEYGVPTNAAAAHEAPESADLYAGDVPAGDVLSRLGDGVYINQLWYCNYSDRPGCRITGMTRFATFLVESGRIVAPLNVMRFDETIYRVLGENLLGLTRERDFIPSSSTYGGRSTGSIRLPGALVKDFAFTL